jgi:hypothetical protein
VFLATPIAVAHSASTGQWLWTAAAIPATIVVCVVIGGVTRVLRATRFGDAIGALDRADRLVSVFAVVGLLAAALAGVGLIWFGVWFNLDADTCDPAQARCVLVVDGVARGETDESVGSQRFSNFILSLVAILPGVMLLVAATWGTRSFARRRNRAKAGG